ncbi:MAG: SGNH/GDSL hydrolase family protein, partial [Pyrinomonadaceae bacterium]
MASKDFNRFRIYDLSACSGQNSDCQSRDLQNFMAGNLPGFSSAASIRFISDDTLAFYVAYSQGQEHKIAKYLLSNSGGGLHQQDYLALGDSYISGEGAFRYLQGTDTGDNKCHVSLVSYPFLLGQELNYNSYHSVACSGATTRDITDTNIEYSGQAKNKVSRQNLEKNGSLPSILSNFQPGYIDQLDFVEQYQPKVITVSVGGNDVGMIRDLKSCLGPGTCFGTYEDRLEFVREVEAKFSTLVSAYTKLRNAGPPDLRIYVIGYPEIAKPDGNCGLNVHLNNDEIIFADQAIDYLDSVIQAAAAKAGVFYVDAKDSFDGHRLCEAKPGSIAMNGLTAGNDIPFNLFGPIGTESYHPNAFGYELLE